MQWRPKEILGAGFVAAAVVVVTLTVPAANAASERALFVSVGASSAPPIGWVEFCDEYPRECERGRRTRATSCSRRKAWNDLAAHQQVGER